MAGAVLMIVSVAFYMLFIGREVAAWAFLAGGVVYSIGATISNGTDAATLTLRRLQRIQRLSCLLLILAGLLMVDDVYLWLLPLFSNYYDFISYVYNKWVLLLLIAALLQLYTSLRMAHEKMKEL